VTKMACHFVTTRQPPPLQLAFPVILLPNKPVRSLAKRPPSSINSRKLLSFTIVSNTHIRQKTLHEVLRRANTRRDIGQNVEGVHADGNHDMAERGKDTAECQPVFEYGREAAREDTTPNEDHFEERNQENFTNDKDRKSPTHTKRGLPDPYEVPETPRKPKQLKKGGHKRLKQRTTRRLDTRRDTGQNVGEIHADRDHDMAERGEDTAECEPVFEDGHEAADADEDHNMVEGEDITSAVAEEPEAGCNSTPKGQEDHFTNDKDLEDHEELFYKIKNPGRKDLRVIPVAGGKLWSSLPSEVSALLDDWGFYVGDVVTVRCTGNPDSLAKVTDIRRLDHERHPLVLAWYYTGEEIQEEFEGLDEQWPLNAPFAYMLSSNRTIVMLDTLRGKALPEVMSQLCPDMFYVTTNSVRKICKARHPHYKWMKKLLDLTPKDTFQPLIFHQDGQVTKRRKQMAG